MFKHLHPGILMISLTMTTICHGTNPVTTPSKGSPATHTPSAGSVKTYQLTRGKIFVRNVSCYNESNGMITLSMDEPGWNTVLSDEHGILMTGKENVRFENLAGGKYHIHMTGPAEGETQEVNIDITTPSPESYSIDAVTPFNCHAQSSGSFVISKQDNGIYDCVITNSGGKEIFSKTITQKEFMADQLEGDIYFVEYLSACRHETIEVDLRDQNQVNSHIDNENLKVETLPTGQVKVTILPDLINVSSCEWKLDDGSTSHDEVFTHEFNPKEKHTLLLTVKNDNCTSAEVIQFNTGSAAALNEVTGMPYASAYIDNNTLNIDLKQMQYSLAEMKIIDRDGKVLWTEKVSDTPESSSKVHLENLSAESFSLLVLNEGIPILSKQFQL